MNYEAPPATLAPLVPRGTELDLWQGHALVSLVGFSFADTRVRGISIPGHRDFEEVNLRFYVRRRTGPDRTVAAVVFMRELVPQVRDRRYGAACSTTSPICLCRCTHRSRPRPASGGEIEYGWRFGGKEFSMVAAVEGSAADARGRDPKRSSSPSTTGATRGNATAGTLEYEVEHPPLACLDHAAREFQGPAAALYGPAFGEILVAAAASAFVAEGSPVTVYSGCPSLEHGPRSQRAGSRGSRSTGRGRSRFGSELRH